MGRMPNCRAPERLSAANRNLREDILLPFPLCPAPLSPLQLPLPTEKVFSPTIPDALEVRTIFLDRLRAGAEDKHPERGARTEESSRLLCREETCCKKARRRRSNASEMRHWIHAPRPLDNKAESKRRRSQRRPFPGPMSTPPPRLAEDGEQRKARQTRLPVGWAIAVRPVKTTRRAAIIAS